MTNASNGTPANYHKLKVLEDIENSILALVRTPEFAETLVLIPNQFNELVLEFTRESTKMILQELRRVCAINDCDFKCLTDKIVFHNKVVAVTAEAIVYHKGQEFVVQQDNGEALLDRNGIDIDTAVRMATTRAIKRAIGLIATNADTLINAWSEWLSKKAKEPAFAKLPPRERAAALKEFFVNSLQQKLANTKQS